MALQDRYEIQAPMGEGGFAKVFRAVERTGGRPVALKVLKRDFHRDAEVRERFQREVFAVASLSSPRIVSLYDFELSEGDVFIAMEYVPGATLRERLYDPLTLSERFTIIEQIGEAIAVAHDRNVVHRDLKPENVKLVERSDGAIEVKVLDFGMAKLASLESSLDLRPLTRSGICFGTPHYMAPEQIRGYLDGASIDLYALTIIAYELLANRLPWDGDDAYEVMRAVLRHPAPPIAAIGGVERPERLAAVNAFFKRALSKQIEDRPRDARVLVEELGWALFGEAGAPRSTLSPLPALRRGDDTMPVAATSSNAAEAASGPNDSDVLPALVSESSLSAGEMPMQTEESLTTPSVGALEAMPELDVVVPPAPVDARAEALAAAQALHAVNRSERGLRGLWLPLLVLIVLGSSVGYLLGGSASAPSGQLHRLLGGE